MAPRQDQQATQQPPRLTAQLVDVVKCMQHRVLPVDLRRSRVHPAAVHLAG